jgi:ribosomal protein L16 Arg81 hydroxylase
MLRAWLDTASQRAFEACWRASRPFAQPSLAHVQPACFDWSVLAEVLASPARDVLVTRDGALDSVVAPTTLAEVEVGLEQGRGLVARRAERSQPGLHALACQFSRERGARVHVQLFVTPAQTRGFSWHYDHEDVVIVQTGGSKSYYFRENTRCKGPLPAQPDFTLLRQEVSPLAVCTLLPGDALYLPRGTWHMGRADTLSFSISIGLERGMQTPP